jgi:hypothetical protein
MPNLLYRADGRLHGCYVYAVICGKAEQVFVKIGMSADPLARLDGIRTGCPLIPHTMALLHVISRDEAVRIESKLHEALKKWRVHGEWFEFLKSDKAAFNTASISVLRSFARQSWPLQWKNMKLGPYLAQKAQKSGYVKNRWRSGGRAFQDALKDGLH